MTEETPIAAEPPKLAAAPAPPPPPAPPKRKPFGALMLAGFAVTACVGAWLWLQQQEIAARIQPAVPTVDPARVAVLESRMGSLQQRLAQLEQRPVPSPAAAAPATNGYRVVV